MKCLTCVLSLVVMMEVFAVAAPKAQVTAADCSDNQGNSLVLSWADNTNVAVLDGIRYKNDKRLMEYDVQLFDNFFESGHDIFGSIATSESLDTFGTLGVIVSGRTLGQQRFDVVYIEAMTGRMVQKEMNCTLQETK